ncbi:MAG TPA: phenylalanine--tRNA ligase subunit beta [Candidatus Margulisiibacteriota bacterium]|nr:phenylalanine--tRNA ligase subunit beta [Candidatus Margulisiibacteriota bacterium]
MKVTYNWLKDFVEIKIPPKELAARLTMAGLEVTSLEEREGDFVFEIEITSNRPDWLSVIGIAREVAAITGKKLLLLAKLRTRAAGAQPFSIKVENKKDCPLYTAKIIRGVKVGESPEWLKNRLRLVGSRSVNNIVDITNYILFEWGEPLHAFDLGRLSSQGSISVRRAKPGEKVVTIDGEEKALSQDMLVIADSLRPVAVAGIMGGKDTEVTWGTRDILLEAAVFNPALIRCSRQLLKLQSESAYRFERSVDAAIVEEASLRAVELITQISGGMFVCAKSSGVKQKRPGPISISLSRVNKALGRAIALREAKDILSSLGFKLGAGRKDNLRVTPPSHRPDVKLEVDLIEEVARISGYDKVPLTLPRVSPRIIPSVKRDLIMLIKDSLLGLGLNEVITYSLIDRSLLQVLHKGQEERAVEILNPLSSEQEVLRVSLIPSLARCASYNLKQKQPYVNIFEIAKVFSKSAPLPLEEYSLGIAFCGSKPLWLGEEGILQDAPGFLHLKGVIEATLKRLGIKETRFLEKNENEFLVQVQDKNLGELRRVKREELEELEIKNKELFLAEINLEKLFSFIRLDKKFTPLPKFPAILRDISVDIQEEVSVEKVLSLIERLGGPLLESAQLRDYYKGKQVEMGFKNLTISCRYSDKERTLAEEEIEPLHDKIIQGLKEELKARIR